MEERSSHLTIVVGASSVAEDLRRHLVQHSVPHAGVTTHLRGLRKSMVLGSDDLIIVCIALDQATLARHGDSLRRLLADCHCFPQSIRSVGLLTDRGMTRDSAAMGCDVYASDSQQAAEAVRLLARRWSSQRVTKTAAQRSRQRAASNRIDSNSWVCGDARFPIEFGSLAKQPSSASTAVKRTSASSSSRRKIGFSPRSAQPRVRKRKPAAPPDLE